LLSTHERHSATSEGKIPGLSRLLFFAERLRKEAEERGKSAAGLKPKDRRFSSIDEVVLATLPSFAKSQLSIHFTHKGAIDKKTVELVSALTAAGQGFNGLAKIMKELACLEYLEIELIYYQTMEALQLRQAQRTSAARATRSARPACSPSY
jgi:hypothetical protein